MQSDGDKIGNFQKFANSSVPSSINEAFGIK